VLTHFTMNDGTFFIVMSEFDRIFERDNLFLRGFVDVVDDGRASSVIICFCEVSLTWLMMAASVVDFPLPVGPVTSTKPFW